MGHTQDNDPFQPSTKQNAILTTAPYWLMEIKMHSFYYNNNFPFFFSTITVILSITLKEWF